MPRPLIYAHRGSSFDHPENTRAAFMAAISDGADGFECDLRLTKDNQVVIWHDSNMLRMANHKAVVAHTNYSDLKKMITEKNAALQSVMVEIGRFRAQTRRLKTYFVNLQALADSPVKDDAGGAVKSLSDSFSKLNKALGKTDGKEKLSEEQKTQIGGLGELVAHTIHGANVKRALERDAEIIGTYLALQENQLGNIVDMLDDRVQNDNDLFLNEKVIAPYVAKDKPLGDSWSKDRREWAKTQCVSQQLKTAQEAAKQLRGVWADILEGKTDINSLSILISDVSEFVTSVQALEAANGAK